MAGDDRTCTNCGNQQSSGAFCERCGTRLPELEVAQPAVGAPPAPAPAAPPAPAPTAVQQPSAPPYQYAAPPQPAAPRVPGPFSKLFDLSFQGFVTRESLRLLFVTTLVLLGVYWVFAFIFGILAAVKLQGYWCIGIFSSLVLVTIMIIWTRILMELTTTVSEIKDDTEKAAKAAAEAAEKASAIAESKPAAEAAAKAAPKAAPKTTKVATTAKATKAPVRKTSK